MATGIQTLPGSGSYKLVLRFEYLSGTDDGFASSVAAPNHHLLGKEDFFSRDLNSQVTTGHHNAIAGLHDLIKPDSKRRRFVIPFVLQSIFPLLFRHHPLKGSITLEQDTQLCCQHTGFPHASLVFCNAKVGGRKTRPSRSMYKVPYKGFQSYTRDR